MWMRVRSHGECGRAVRLSTLEPRHRERSSGPASMWKLIDSSERRKCVCDEELEGRAPDRGGPGLEDAFHRSANGSRANQA
ncbi:hypothetical protein F2P81_023845 [Scophthalmus maximus]|uniref:Uncharacterized protein n=1 Tax=Scophthalmus maximus TaxID=52904 RepID=A0A6A4RSR3_SCOMX|nr:hypothetical protein F2P81_023845 [Scophthalmus maximus]